MSAEEVKDSGRSFGGLLATSTFISHARGGGIQRLNKDSAPASAGTQSADSTGKKVHLGAGYSQMDWMRLTKTQNDLAGVAGASTKRKVTLEEVKQHNRIDDCWTVLRGKVYNLTPYVNFHPGGDKILKAIIARDCTNQFDKYHKWVNGEYMLEKCKVGVLDTHVPSGSDDDEEEEEEEFSFR